MQGKPQATSRRRPACTEPATSMIPVASASWLTSRASDRTTSSCNALDLRGSLEHRGCLRSDPDGDDVAHLDRDARLVLPGSLPFL